MEIYWEQRTSRSTIGSEFRLIIDGNLTGYVITYDPIFDVTLIHYKSDKLIESEMSIEEAKSWCERDFKLELLTRT
jgi:hypothetical protein